MDKKNQKVMLVLVDGIGDRGIPSLDGKTPMQHLNLPYHDLLSKSGQNGLMDSVEAGYGCGSDTSHMNIFGYSPFVNYRGRGAFETMGSGLPMIDGDIAFKCNFAHMDENKIVKLRRVDRDFPEWGLPLIDNQNKIVIPGFENYKVSALHATEHRIGLKVSGPDLTNNITGTDPLKDNLKLVDCESTESDCEKSQKTADLVNALSIEMNKVLELDPINKQRAEQNLPTANIVLLRGCGIKINLQPFEERHGMKGWATCPTCILNGLSQCVNFDTYKVDGATGDYHENLFASAEKAVELFMNGVLNEKGEQVDYQFGFYHVKQVDETGHDKNLEKRLFWHEEVDRVLKFFQEKWSPIYKEKGIDQTICITGDHSTPVLYGDHTHEPVPFAISSIGLMSNEQDPDTTFVNDIKDQVDCYDEVSCAKGSLGRFTGCEAIEFMKNFNEFTRKKLGCL